MTTYKKGDKVKDFKSSWEQPYNRGIVTETHDNRAELLLIEGDNKGETVERNNENIEPLQQKTWLCLIARNYGTAQTRENALRNALLATDIPENHDEPINVWMAEVDKTNWDIRGMGSVHSTFIENEDEFEIKPDLAREISNRAEDTQDVTISALNESEPYYEGLNYRTVERTRY